MAANEILQWKSESNQNKNAADAIGTDQEFKENNFSTFQYMADSYGSEERLLEEHDISGVNRGRVLPLLRKLRPHWNKKPRT